jgi:hypothetical protein
LSRDFFNKLLGWQDLLTITDIYAYTIAAACEKPLEPARGLKLV